MGVSVGVVETALASWVSRVQREDREAAARIGASSRSGSPSSSSASPGPGSRVDVESARSGLFLIGVVARVEGPVVPPVRASQDPVFLDEALAGPTASPAPPPGSSAPGSSVPGSEGCLLYTSPSPRDKRQSRMPSSA